VCCGCEAEGGWWWGGVAEEKGSRGWNPVKVVVSDGDLKNPTSMNQFDVSCCIIENSSECKFEIVVRATSLEEDDSPLPRLSVCLRFPLP
jgi:hypothetical protein